MNEQARKAQAAYIREYRRKHPEKVRKWRENYWNKKAEQGVSENVETQENDGRTVPEVSSRE